MSHLTPSDRAALGDLIDAELARASGQLAALRSDFDAIVEEADLATPDDEHDPEGATLAFERAQLTTLLSRARSHIADLERAREQLGQAGYGTCQRCRQPIGLERLRARPAAQTCVSCATVPASSRRRT